MSPVPPDLPPVSAADLEAAATWWINRFVRSSSARRFMLRYLGLTAEGRPNAGLIKRNAEYCIRFRLWDGEQLEPSSGRHPYVIAVEPESKAAEWAAGMLIKTPTMWVYRSALLSPTLGGKGVSE